MSDPLTLREVAERLGVTTRHVRTLIDRKRLPAIDVGANPDRAIYRIHPDDLAEFMRKRATRTTHWGGLLGKKGMKGTEDQNVNVTVSQIAKGEVL